MQKLVLIFISIISVSLSQVVPSYQPYSLMHPEIELSAAELTMGNDIYLNFIDNAHLTIQPTGIVYRLAIKFIEIQSGHLSIEDWHVPEGAMLFIFNNQESYTGPYLSKDEVEFSSGRFISDRITLEYFEPINSEFTGNFKINGMLGDYVM